MHRFLVRSALVAALVGAVAAPQVTWHLFSDERHTMTSADIEKAVGDEFQQANSTILDRLECESIPKPPGVSYCTAQEADKIFGLVLEVDADGDTDLFNASTADRTDYTGSG